MEWNDRGIKDADDVIEALRDGASAHRLHQLYGERISGLLAEALDSVWNQVTAYKVQGFTGPGAPTTAERMAAWVHTFPSLRGRPGTHPWDPRALQRWARSASSGERHLVRFCLHVWNPYTRWSIGKFDLVEVCTVLDEFNRAALIRWIQNPWYP